ncbi:MAG TPA: tripartite tricarboxylate transporter substrate binding protein [Burkholderiales bacterium]|nr:tripartite tricarboxylate transporter substrate binding protein [Burkholderiales bacterium]
MKTRIRNLGHAAFAALALSLSAAASAQANYPDHPIRLVIPFPPGGSNDIVGRLIADQLSKRLGQQVVVDNRGGAGGTIGTEMAATAIPDGYTLLFVSSAFASNPSMYKLTYNQEKAFAPVGMIAAGPNVLAVVPTLPVKNVVELIALAKAKPGMLYYASAGIGSFQHLGGALFASMAGINIVHVPFKGGGPAMVDVMAGNTQMTFSSLVQTLSLMRSGKLKALGVGGSKRSPTAPEVPTIAESGLPGYEALNWWGIVTATGTPAPIVTRLHNELQTIVQSPELKKRFESEAVEGIQISAAAFKEYIDKDTVKWAKVIKEVGIKAE